MALLDLPGDYASDVRPARNGTGRKAWAKDPTGPASTDGTRLDATLINDLIGLIRATLAAFSIDANPGDDSALAQAISAAMSSAVDGLAPINSPAFTGTPLAPTATASDNSQAIATTAFVAAAVAALVDSTPPTLDTLKELAVALGEDPNFATTITTALGLKAPLASPSFTGSPTAPTQTAGDNSTKLSTTEFVATAIAALSLGTASQKAAGTLAGQVLLLAANNKLPALDGSALTGLPSAPVSSVVGQVGAVSAAQIKSAVSYGKGDVGLGNVDNTSDANKPVSTAQQTALDLKLAITGLAAAVAALSAGGISTLAFAKSDGGQVLGNTVAGSSLTLTNVASENGSGTLSGTWRCMGYSTSASGAAKTTLWQRIS